MAAQEDEVGFKKIGLGGPLCPFPFTIVIDVLSRLIYKTQDKGAFNCFGCYGLEDLGLWLLR